MEEARRLGISKVVLTHALGPRSATLSVERRVQMAAKGAYIEHTYLSTLPSGGGVGMRKLIDAIQAVGASRCILTTDLGQKENLPPAEGLREAVASLLRRRPQRRRCRGDAEDQPGQTVGPQLNILKRN